MLGSWLSSHRQLLMAATMGVLVAVAIGVAFFAARIVLELLVG